MSTIHCIDCGILIWPEPPVNQDGWFFHWLGGHALLWIFMEGV